MRDYSHDWICWYNNVFKTMPLWDAMENTVEDSPWHRERNVAVHTDMVVMEYLRRADKRMDRHALMGAFVCAFHDVAKPRARTEKYSKERGVYYSYPGHEQMSARMWEQFAVQNWRQLRDDFDFTEQEIYYVGVMIEHHVPWGMRKKDKLDGVILTAYEAGGRTTFANILLSDTYGRISDDAEEKRMKSEEWIGSQMLPRAGWDWWMDKSDGPRLIVPIGASGSGKSSLFHKVQEECPGIEYYSLDQIRLDLHPPKGTTVDMKDTYAYSWMQATKDPTFKAKSFAIFMDMVRTGNDIYLDNTNLTRKVRNKYLIEASKRGYRTVAYYFPIALEDLIARQKTRYDKEVPEDAVTRHWWSVQLPLYKSEFDDIFVVGSNLPKSDK